jgi:hypothetical protein
MRRPSTAAAAVLFALALPAGVAAQTATGHVEGFGGFTFGDVATASTFGGQLAVPLTSHVQIIGEGGRMTDLMPALIDTALDFTPVDVRLEAWYGEGGVRFLGGGGGVRPYGEATAGIARIRPQIAGFKTQADFIANTALRFLDDTKPLLGVGGGVLLHGGPVVLDLGYRYKRVVGGDDLQSILTGGDFGFSQIRVGLGFRF